MSGTARSTGAARPSSTRPTPAPPSSGSSTAKACSTRPTPRSPYYGKILPGKQAAICLAEPGQRRVVHDVPRLRRVVALPARPDPPVHGAGAAAGGRVRDPRRAPSCGSGRTGRCRCRRRSPNRQRRATAKRLGTLSQDRIDGILDDVGWPVDADATCSPATSGSARKRTGPAPQRLDAIWDAVDAEFPGVANCWMSQGRRVHVPGPAGPVPPRRRRVQDQRAHRRRPVRLGPRRRRRPVSRAGVVERAGQPLQRRLARPRSGSGHGASDPAAEP